MRSIESMSRGCTACNAGNRVVRIVSIKSPCGTGVTLIRTNVINAIETALKK